MGGSSRSGSVRLGFQKGSLGAVHPPPRPLSWAGLIPVQGCRRTHFPRIQRPDAPPSTLEKAKASPLQRGHRARVKACRRTALVEWDDATVGLLIRADALTPKEVEDYTRAEIGAAITKLLDVSVQKAIQDGVIKLRRG